MRPSALAKNVSCLQNYAYGSHFHHWEDSIVPDGFESSYPSRYQLNPDAARQALVNCLKPFQQAPDDAVAMHCSDLCSMHQCLRKGSRMGQSFTIVGHICNLAVAICIATVFSLLCFDSGRRCVFFCYFSELWPNPQKSYLWHGNLVFALLGKYLVVFQGSTCRLLTIRASRKQARFKRIRSFTTRPLVPAKNANNGSGLCSFLLNLAPDDWDTAPSVTMPLVAIGAQ